MGMKYKVKLLLSMLLMSGLSLVEQLSFSETGKYCETPARCLNPITTQIMVTSPNYLATQAVWMCYSKVVMRVMSIMGATAPRGDGLVVSY